MLKVFALASLLTQIVSGHISLIYPCPRYSPVGINCPAVPPGQSLEIDSTTINSPINSIQLGGTMPLCRHTTPCATPSATWTAGQSVTIKFNPHAATHSGGHCEFSISYDNGKTFAVIYQVLRSCFRNGIPATIDNSPEVLQYTFNLPADLPSSDKAVFAWTWVNASGNREFYMNCADVAITGSKSTSYTGKKMTIVNYPGYPTAPEFNHNYDTAIDLYTSTEKVTVSPNGSGSSGGSGDPNSSAGASVKAYNANAAVSSAVATTLAAAAATEVTSAGVPKSLHINKSVDAAGGSSGACSGALMQCSGTGYQMCVNGAWSPVYPCGPGTACKSSSPGAIFCGWP